MLIDLLQRKLFTAQVMEPVTSKLGLGEDASLGVAASVRPFVVAAAFARHPRPMLVIVSGNDAAVRFARDTAAYIGREQVLVLPERKDLPWGESAPGLKEVGARTQAMGMLAAGRNVVVVTSARALLRRVPAQGNVFAALEISQDGGAVDGATGEVLEYEQIAAALVARGYQHLDQLDGPGTFSVHGDAIDIFGAGMTTPVRIDFWGDEVEGLRRVVASTGQTIGQIESVQVWPCREFAVTQPGLKRARKKLRAQIASDEAVAEGMRKLEAGISFAGMERFLPYLADETCIPIAHAADSTLVVLAEPRSLFDDASRRYEELCAHAANNNVTQDEVAQLFCAPARMDFGTQQRLTLQSMMRVGALVDAELPIERPSFQGREDKLVATLAALADSHCTTLFAVPDRNARKDMELMLTDNGISYVENLAASARDLRQDLVNMTDVDVAGGFIMPDAHLALLSISDLSQRASRRRRASKKVDVTDITFPFKPGDYVVHASHGIALFKDIVRQEVAGAERDYLLLAYAQDDKLFVPVEQIDRITRYVGPDGSAPRLTRLHTADWSRAMGKARKSAKKLAFDLVDLYARRSTVKGYSYSPDGEFMVQMEDLFPYEETPDQLSAIADVKADMESEKPMDRLICGDVGFGKTEVAMRAAFKAVSDHRQVMILCPTTILAQQHYATFSDRFSPFGICVEVLSRFRTAAQQKAALEGFAKGEVDVLVGTHRLLSRDVNPKELGLVIIDEEQRFGVGHKEQLKNLRESVDVLTLSATPIPRTLQMSLSGVRDMSLITTPPTNRRPVKVHVGEWDDDLISAAIRRELERGGQVYYVSNRVRTIDDAEEAVHQAVPEARVGVAHGQMAPHQVEDMMERFNGGEVDVLVATTIVESGLDNPHANTLIIEDSQRLGLAQLYQLKGRVGRSTKQAYAYFLFPSDRPLTEEATRRLEAIGEFTDLGSGMRVAMKDLEIRGAGSLLGAEQSGNMSAVGFDLFASLLAEAVSDARGEDKLAYPEVHVDVAADFVIPAEYIPDGGERVEYYRRLAAALTAQDVDAIADRMRSKYGALPQPAANICNRARIKAYCEAVGATSVAQVGGKLVIGEVSKLTNAAISSNAQAKKLLTKLRALYVPNIKAYRIPVAKGEPVVDIAAEALAAMAQAVEETQE